MGNYPTKASQVEDPFAQTYGTASDSYEMFYTHKGGQEVQLQKGSIQICKIYSMGGEMFFFDQGVPPVKIMLTRKGVLRPDAKRAVKTAKGYGNPMVWVCGSLDNPTYMSTITNLTTDKWEMVSYKTWRGLQKGATSWRDPMRQDTFHRQHLGSMSINIFEEHRASTMMLDGRKITAAIDSTFQGTVSSVLEMALDAITLGTASPLMEISGLSAAIDKLGVDTYEKSFGSGHQTAGSVFTNWAKHSGVDTNKWTREETKNRIIDERVPIAITKMKKLAKFYGVDEKFGHPEIDFSKYSPADKIVYYNSLKYKVTIEAVEKQTADFKQSLKITKEFLPTVDLSMFDLGGRLSPEERLLQLARYKKTFKATLMPSLTKIYQHRQSLKVQPETGGPTTPEGGVQEETTSPKKDKTAVNKKLSNKIVLGDPRKGGLRVNITVKG